MDSMTEGPRRFCKLSWRMRLMILLGYLVGPSVKILSRQVARESLEEPGHTTFCVLRLYIHPSPNRNIMYYCKQALLRMLINDPLT